MGKLYERLTELATQHSEKSADTSCDDEYRIYHLAKALAYRQAAILVSRMAHQQENHPLFVYPCGESVEVPPEAITPDGRITLDWLDLQYAKMGFRKVEEPVGELQVRVQKEATSPEKQLRFCVGEIVDLYAYHGHVRAISHVSQHEVIITLE